MSKREPYEAKTVRTARAARRLQRKGWELVGQSGGFLLTATTYNLRRPNPHYRGATA